ncbi:cytochrome c oxidase assembly protein [Pigmentiphaga aceris]|uniref:Cytochrome c oxidase assembly protein CtaG n=2 Tax=Pigmentiphaga aceris TaxID=1940612 RepID=A0A5C0B7L7_9BURK|nr:cytochrome c oxidase assembly protein [Pigmentiphaga aceris]
MPSAASQGARNTRMLKKLAVVTVMMFGFGYALIPLYDVFCEITGINFLTQADGKAEDFARNTQVDSSRSVKVVFDANIKGPWRFHPTMSSVTVHPGELTTVVYEIANQQDKQMVGQAIPSYMPMAAAQHFKKLECFCFAQQDLKPHEARSFPVVFVVDPKLPKDVTEITLSYTFFEIPGRVAGVEATRVTGGS